MTNSNDNAKRGVAPQQTSKASPAPAGKPQAAADAKATPAPTADDSKHARHSAAEHEKMKGRS